MKYDIQVQPSLVHEVTSNLICTSFIHMSYLGYKVISFKSLHGHIYAYLLFSQLFFAFLLTLTLFEVL
jgi:hypothetical protein